MSVKKRRRVCFLFFFCFLLGSLKLEATTFFGTVQTGLFKLQDYKHAVYLFVPPKYNADRDYPLMISIPGLDESPEENIRYWLGLAKRKSMIVVAPTNLWPQDVPDRMDEWILRIKRDVEERYRISPVRTFLVGKGLGAHYASYLATKYPQEFSAVALLGGSWVGQFEPLIFPQKKPYKQVPFFVALTGAQEGLMHETRKIALEFEKRGYPVYVVSLGGDQSMAADEFKKKVLEWLEDKSRVWHQVAEESKKPFKERFLSNLEEFFRL